MVASIIFGAIGGAIILAAYLLELFKHIPPENKWFLLANVIGSAFLFTYALMLENIVFMITNGVWALGSLYELWSLRT